MRIKYLIIPLLFLVNCANMSNNISVNNSIISSKIIIRFRIDDCNDINLIKRRPKAYNQYWKTIVDINEKRILKNEIKGGESIIIPIAPGDNIISYSLSSTNNCDISYRTGRSFFGMPASKKLYLHIKDKQTINLKIVNVENSYYGCGCIGGSGSPIIIPIPQNYQDVSLEKEINIP